MMSSALLLQTTGFDFDSIDKVRRFCDQFFACHNQDHQPAGIGQMTPDRIDFGQVDAIHASRQITLDSAFLGTPERFVR